MKEVNRIVTSREFKVMLKSDLFRDREAGRDAMWALVKSIVVKNGGTAKQDDKEIRRTTWYLDTPELELRQRHGYILRVREEKDSIKKYKFTLKYRDGDRYVSASKDTSFTDDLSFHYDARGDEISPKFEEDIVPEFQSKFSNSTSVETDESRKIDSVGAAAELYSGLGLLDIPLDTPIRIVRGFQAHEVAVWLGKLKFGGEKVKSALSFWYLSDEEQGPPLVAELSFDYDLPKDYTEELERYPLDLVEGADALFEAMLQTTWVSRGATTKTSYAYEGSSS